MFFNGGITQHLVLDNDCLSVETLEELIYILCFSFMKEMHNVRKIPECSEKSMSPNFNFLSQFPKTPGNQCIKLSTVAT